MTKKKDEAPIGVRYIGTEVVVRINDVPIQPGAIIVSPPIDRAVVDELSKRKDFARLTEAQASAATDGADAKQIASSGSPAIIEAKTPDAGKKE